MKIYKAMSAIQAELSGEGIAKGKKNQQQGFMYRGIDDTYMALSPLLAKHGVLILPKVLDRNETVRQTAKGGLLYDVVLQVEYSFVCVEDGSIHTCITFGEGMDSADKATSKALSVAFKYLILQAFAVPTEGASPDADADSHPETVAKKVQQPMHVDVDKLFGQGEHAASLGMKMLETWWKGLDASERKAIGDDGIQSLKEMAA